MLDMTERTTTTEITFLHPFRLKSYSEPLEAGTYRLVVDEELIEGVSFTAYRKVATYLELPAISVAITCHQVLQVSSTEIDEALARDAANMALGSRDTIRSRD
ncbi:hypothetical protein Brsp01_26480 [Brucella sp. NBRC 12950]|nr:hypothetical protein Brsp01_26480 [Brucella sp. NBRC 12950]